MEKKSDLNIIDSVLSGNANAYAGLVDKYKDMAFTVAVRILRNAEEAEEIAQDAFLSAFRSLRDFKKDSNFGTWLYRIVYNAAISKLRKRKDFEVSLEKPHLENLDTAELNAGLEKMEQDEKIRYIREALTKLPEEESSLLTLFYLNENSVKEIAEITGISHSNVKVKLFRARKHLFGELYKLLKNELHNLA